MYNPGFRPYCQYRPYYISVNKYQNTCFFFGEQVLTRGLYAAQLAWWFQLFPPQNFIILNSHEFFADPVGQLNRVNAFFGVEESFRESMTHSQGMKGKYNFKDPHKEAAKAYLREFYERPNKELYKLLDEVGLGPFAPFGSVSKSLSPASPGSTEYEPEPEEQNSTVSKVGTEGDQGPVDESKKLDESSNSSDSDQSTFNQMTGSTVFLIGAEGGASSGQTEEGEKTPEEPVHRNWLVLGHDAAFHKKPAPETGFLFPGVSRAGYYFALTVLVIVVILWIMRSSRQGGRSISM